jgi:hypothetical protein
MPVQGVQAAVAIGGLVADIADKQKRREAEQNIALMDVKQRAALERELQRTNSLDKRREILANAFSSIKAAQTSAILSSTIQSRALAKSKKETNTAIIIIGGAVAILAAIVIIKKS